MASRPTTQTNIFLILFLLSIGVFVFGALYFDTLQKNRQLSAQVLELQQNQVLLMVPDQQAEAIAQWLANNPQQTMALVEQAKSGRQTAVAVGPQVTPYTPDDSLSTMVDDGLATSHFENVPPYLANKTTDGTKAEDTATFKMMSNQSKRDDAPKLVAEVVSEGQENVKVIRLPHGGIRVTTREQN